MVHGKQAVPPSTSGVVMLLNVYTFYCSIFLFFEEKNGFGNCMTFGGKKKKNPVLSSNVKGEHEKEEQKKTFHKFWTKVEYRPHRTPGCRLLLQK